MTFAKSLRKLQDIGSALGRTRTCHLLCSWSLFLQGQRKTPGHDQIAVKYVSYDARPGDREMLRDLHELAK
jgi:hypothetical protein